LEKTTAKAEHLLDAIPDVSPLKILHALVVDFQRRGTA
jgi:hypothetical protein